MIQNNKGRGVYILDADELYSDFTNMSVEEQMKFLELLRRMRNGIIAKQVKKQREANVEVSGLMKRLMDKK